MKISYDKSTDTLYLFVSDQGDTVAREAGNGILVKYDKANRKVGVVIHDFEKRFKKSEPGALEIPALA